MKTLIRSFVVIAALGVVGACDSNNSSSQDLSMPSSPDDMSSNTDLSGNPDMTPTCATNPMTHLEIINACTNADSYDKLPFYPTLAPNGALPALP